jgi:Predicted metal-dependent phosphoesterases (PHP family)
MYYDLHIHSCLSPCADDDMTPANIAGMARLKGLDMISLTDHNSGGNLSAMDEAARENGLVFVPGVEATSREEAHILVYFAALGEALRFTQNLYDSLPDIDNRPGLFGRQLLAGDDEPAGEVKKLLLQATPYSVEELAARAREAGGVAVPAHINRDSFSVISNLGFLPPGLFKTVEVAQGLPCPDIGDAYRILHSSDAHDLGSISEPAHSISGIKTAGDLIARLCE